MKNREIADVLEEIALFLEIEDVDFKPRAYRRAAQSLAALSEDIDAVYEREELEEIDGVGSSIAEKIAEYLETGAIEYHQELKADLPIDVEAITRVEGVGPKTAKTLYDELDVRDLDDLESAAESGRIGDLSGFGEKSQQNILDHIEFARTGQERLLLGDADPIARRLEADVSAAEAFDDVTVVGSYRRRRPTVGDLDVLATSPDPAQAMATFCEHDDVTEVLARGETKSSVLVGGGYQVDLRIVDHSEYGAALIYFTGSKDHNVELRSEAIDRDWKLNEYGLFDVSEVNTDDAGEGQRVGEVVASETEAAVYDALDMAWIPPELRENTGEVGVAQEGTLPELVTAEDVRGDLQMHTTYSDGAASVREMAVAAAERGREYVLLTDHGPSVQYAGGLSREEFDEQAADIAAVNEDPDIACTVLQGIEAEITTDGLDTPPAWCEACDLVVAGMHTTPEDPTARIVDAIETGQLDILAHPTNRLLNERKPLELSLDAVADAAAANDVALEINAQPSRLDLDWSAVKEYRDQVGYVVSTDAHSRSGQDTMHLGVDQARRGWCDADDVVNTRPLEDLLAWFGKT
jgi:DNA polymerase (family 10)